MSVSKDSKIVHHKTAAHHDAPLLESLVKPITIKPYHHKPFRVRHVGWLLLALLALFGLTLQTGLMIGRSKAPASIVNEKPQHPSSSVTNLRSGLGFSFMFDGDQFDATATAVSAEGSTTNVTFEDLREGKNINSVTLRPLKGTVRANQAATRLVMQVDTDKSFVSLRAQSQNNNLSDIELAAKQFSIPQTPEFTVTIVSATAETLNGVAVQKTVYEYVPKFGGGKSYAVTWAGFVGDYPFVLRLLGLVGSTATPDAYQSIFDSLDISSQQKVAGVNTFFGRSASAQAQFDSKYQSDLVSPAVVKIYHLICGTLVVGGQPLGENTCDGMTGSGFLVSSDGYIATNGHVVVFTAKDAFANALVDSPALFTAFLRSAGLTSAQIAAISQRADLQASIIAKIYDLPDTAIKFTDQKEATFVALGNEPMAFASVKDVRDAIDKSDTDKLKKAEILATNYAAKDLYVLQSGKNEGFSSSDVALLKIKVSNAPVVIIGSGQVTQNQKISLLGFPGDAENQLVSRDHLSVSVTNGNISSIREAAGGLGKLYQSDADASHGNSGGPAIGEDGEVIGLLTYRFKGGQDNNAAKSYIRDIADFSKLAASEHVTFNTTSTTQDAWKKGLELVSTNHYSAAIKQFSKVKSTYPAHRLVGSYIESSKQAIAAGKDVKDFPIALLIAGMVFSLGGVMTAVVVIARHHAKHQLYKISGQTSSDAGGPSGSLTQSMQTVPVAISEQSDVQSNHQAEDQVQ